MGVSVCRRLFDKLILSKGSIAVMTIVLTSELTLANLNNLYAGFTKESHPEFQR
ncbi:hypothetical protein EV199_2321 [Pseudobacter ginsenosidimutans]|jgi:hypothetical protein|uniref:Uncharacterized protein n=1 Tax=Pseudobacter ginsenosidimutans TaxID=661488 RepID=A0A4Q7N5U9_9BACT|nr:hypothetical protein EV199_2321 [Pseudobacter ginsenosidimutans]